jgi:hypothetical protein
VALLSRDPEEDIVIIDFPCVQDVPAIHVTDIMMMIVVSFTGLLSQK